MLSAKVDYVSHELIALASNLLRSLVGRLRVPAWYDDDDDVHIPSHIRAKCARREYGPVRCWRSIKCSQDQAKRAN